MEPTTIAAIASAAKSYFEKQSDEAWKTGVSSKLNEISQKLDTVIIQLRDLQVWILIIDGKISQIAPDIFKSQVEGNRIQIESLAPGVRQGTANLSQKRAMETAHSLITQAFGSLYDWNKFGFTHYYAVISGVMTQLYAGSVLRFDKASMRKIRTGAIENYFSPAVDPANPKSLEYARLQAAARMEQARTEGAALVGTAYVSNFNPGAPSDRDDRGKKIPGIPCEYMITTISGSVEAGFTYSRQKKDGPGGWEPSPWFPGLRHFDMGDGDSSLNDIRVHMDGLTKRFVDARDQMNALAAHVAAIQTTIEFLGSAALLERDAPVE